MRIWEGFQKGVNLGGWISQFAAYDPAHFESFITEKDIADIAALGFDHVRVPVDYNVLEDEEGRFRESGFGYLENCRRWCRAHGLRMLIDLHECYGYSFDPLKKGMDRRRFFYDEALQRRFLALWMELARRFGDDPARVAFEPLNEVVLQDVAEAWNALVRRFIETVRPLAPESRLVIGGVCYNHVSSVALLDPPFDDKVVYNFHCYEPHIFTHQGAYWEERMPPDFRTGYPETPETYRRLSREILGETEGSCVFREDLRPRADRRGKVRRAAVLRGVRGHRPGRQPLQAPLAPGHPFRVQKARHRPRPVELQGEGLRPGGRALRLYPGGVHKDRVTNTAWPDRSGGVYSSSSSSSFSAARYSSSQRRWASIRIRSAFSAARAMMRYISL